MDTEQIVIFDRFLNEVAPKLAVNPIGINTVRPADVLTAEQVVLALSGLELQARAIAELKGISTDAARREIFDPLKNCLPGDTEQELLAAMQQVHIVPPTAKGLALIGSIMSRSGVLITRILRHCFLKIEADLLAFIGWSKPLYIQAMTYIKYRYEESLSAISEHGRIMWSWCGKQVVIVNHASMNCLAAAAGYAHVALEYVFRSLNTLLRNLNETLGDWVADWDCMKSFHQDIALSKPCPISFPHKVIMVKSGITYVKVTMPIGDWRKQEAILRAEIAGCGVFCK